MLENYNKWRVLRVFFDNPEPRGAKLQLREISRKSGIAPKSVKNYLDELSRGRREPVVSRGKHRIHGYPVYWANRSSQLFRLYKKTDMVLRLHESGLVQHLGETCMPDVIVLFGSASRGEDIAGSDVDLYLQCAEKSLKLEKYEKSLNRRISVLFESEFGKLSKELRNNIINGIILAGYLKVF